MREVWKLGWVAEILREVASCRGGRFGGRMEISSDWAEDTLPQVLKAKKSWEWRKWAAMYILLSLLSLTGCAGSAGNIFSNDPTERGLSYVASAIVTAAIIRALCNK